MEETIIMGVKIQWEKPEEILGMGGPWIGNLLINEKIVSVSVIVDNFVFDKITNRFFFVKYIQISKWASKNYFSIFFYSIASGELITLEEKYRMVYLDSINDKAELVIYKSFHNNDESKKDFVKLN
jgi:hypothetical protein